MASIVSSKNIPLTQLSTELEQQFATMASQKNCSQTYLINELAVTILVQMTREDRDDGIPEEAEICGGVKGCEDTAIVEISPTDERVSKAVADYFNQPGHFDLPRQFDVVMINGIPLEMP